MKNLRLGILLMMVGLSSCLTPQKAKEKYGCKEIATIEKTDTTEKVREVPVFIPADSATIFIPALDYKKHWGDAIVGHGSKNASVIATYDTKKGGYTIVANCDSLTKTIEAKDRIISMFKTSIVKQEQEKKSWLGQKINNVYDFLIKLFALIGVISIVYFLIKFIPNPKWPL
jgi:hypothetical protein